MTTVEVALYSLAAVLVLLVLYRYAFNPQVLLTARRADMAQCPDRWVFADGLCRPTYNTECAAFDPTTITSGPEGCNLARTCGTNWSGFCG
jgi:hypothetical protein